MSTLVYMLVYNEEKYLSKAINSVLKQDCADFLLLISNNHSTDDSAKIIESFSYDPRIIPVSPPEFYSSLRHGEWIHSYISSHFKSVDFTIFIGGHDIWSTNYLSILKQGMIDNPNSSIVYTDSYDIDTHDNVLKKHEGHIVSVEVPKPLRPMQILLGLTHNLIIGGLWRESVRSQIQTRYRCMGIDHFQVAEAALLGDIVYKYGGDIGLRVVEGANDWNTYIKKHLGLQNPSAQDGIKDFANQLDWAIFLQEKSLIGSAFYNQPHIKDSLISAMANGYLNRYWAHLQAFEAIPEFLTMDEIKSVLSASSICINSYKKFIDKVQA